MFNIKFPDTSTSASFVGLTPMFAGTLKPTMWARTDSQFHVHTVRYIYFGFRRYTESAIIFFLYEVRINVDFILS